MFKRIDPNVSTIPRYLDGDFYGNFNDYFDWDFYGNFDLNYLWGVHIINRIIAFASYHYSKQ